MDALSDGKCGFCEIRAREKAFLMKERRGEGEEGKKDALMIKYGVWEEWDRDIDARVGEMRKMGRE